MGQLCSDACSSSSFYLGCEKSFALDVGVQRKFGVMVYLRFKDDIFVLCSGPQNRHKPFFDELFKRSGCYVLKFDEVSNSGFNMLDVDAFKRQ